MVPESLFGSRQYLSLEVRQFIIECERCQKLRIIKRVWYSLSMSTTGIPEIAITYTTEIYNASDPPFRNVS